jgi:hypothetical protein
MLREITEGFVELGSLMVFAAMVAVWALALSPAA